MNILNEISKRASALLLGFSVLFSGMVSAEDLLNLEVKEAGVYQVSHQQLLAYGLDISGEPLAQISLSNRGQSVSIQLVGSNADSSVFGDGALIRFIAEGLDTLYTDTNVYTLKLNGTSQRLITNKAVPLARRVPFASSYLASKKFAPQAEYSFASPDKNDPWYAKRVLALSEPGSERVSITLDDYLPGGNSGSTSAKMKVKVWGGSDLPGSADDHHVQVRFNGQKVIDDTFDGFSKKEMQSTVSNLRNGTNSIDIDLPLDQGFAFEAVNLDSVEIKYPRAFVAIDDALSFSSSAKNFRIRGFGSEQIRVYQYQSNGDVSELITTRTGGRCQNGRSDCGVQFSNDAGVHNYYVVADSGIKTPSLSAVPVNKDIRSGDAEYLVITHPDFIAEAGEADLLGGFAAELEDDFESVDVVDVEQIYAQFGNHIFDPEAVREYIKFAAQNRGTKVVLLVGGDIYDYRGFENQNARSFIPSIYVATGDVISFAPVDAKYVDLDNNNTPDLPIGRLPVRSMTELKSLLDKRTAYMNRSYRQTALFAADGFDDLEQYSFKVDAQRVAQDYFQGWAVDDAYTDDLGVQASRAKIIDRINQGVSLTSFFGHSSTNQWTFDGLFNGFDAANLANVDKPTIVTQWGCWNTYYVNPNEDSMGHRFMMEGNRGAVAVMGATTLTSASNERLLATLVFDRLSKGENLGDAITNGKAEFASSKAGALDVILGWTLLGFPELTL